MASTVENNKRIAKNTAMLYIRMLLIMTVTLYTSRVVLEVLGVEDFGIYNVIGGIVAMFSIISSSLSSAISRFITFELGRGNEKNLQMIFSSSIIIQCCLALLICILIEIGGVWFLNSRMNIPMERMNAANWVMQCSILTFMVNLISVPYNAVIIAHERMKVFAYLSVLEAVLKLLIVFILYLSLYDKLKLYAILLLFVTIFVRFVYGYYCKRHFKECTFYWVYDKMILRQIGSFASWNFIGSSSAILRDQGGNILVNIFSGPIVNAAYGIAMQVNTAIQSFATNFMTALNPQIIKAYAADNKKYMMMLVFQGARFSFYLLFLFSLPILINTHYILHLWLKNVPEHTILFVQLILIFTLCESISYPLITAQHATGRIRNYQLIVGSLQMMNLPVSYFLLRISSIPEIVIVVAIFISQCCLVARLIILQGMLRISIRNYMLKVYFNVLIVSASSAILPVLLVEYLEETLLNFIITSVFSFVSTLGIIYFIGCNRKEKIFIKSKYQYLKSKIVNR